MDIVLCATQRCGSTLILEDMRNSGVLGFPEEWFIPWTPDKENADWQEALASVTKRATDDTGVSAVKIMANQLFALEGCLSTFVAAEAEASFPHVAAAFKDASWVFLRRQDVVSQAISRVMAQQTGINHAVGKADDAHFAGNLALGYDTNYNTMTQYRYGAILRHVSAIVLENLAWEEFFKSNGISPLCLVYEDVIKDKDMGHLDLLARSIGLQDAPPRRERAMVKLGNERNRKWRERFFRDAVKNRFMPPIPKKAL